MQNRFNVKHERKQPLTRCDLFAGIKTFQNYCRPIYCVAAFNYIYTYINIKKRKEKILNVRQFILYNYIQ